MEGGNESAEDRVNHQKFKLRVFVILNLFQDLAPAIQNLLKRGPEINSG
jgi:hypothetical protein